MTLPHVVGSPLVGSRYELGRVIGKGGYATVYRAVDTATGASVAIKRITKTPATVYGVRNEVKLATAVQHPNIVRIHDVIHEDAAIYIVMDLFKCTLFERLLRSPMSDEELFTTFHQIVSALTRLHVEGIRHSDVKLENVMLTEDGTAKLIDFGLATTTTFSNSRSGSPHYMPPEMWKFPEPYDGLKADSWSLGCLFYCMTFRKMPFHSTPSCDVATKVLTQNVEFLNSDCVVIAPQHRDLLQLLLEKDPTRRLSVKGIASHPFWLLSCRQYNLCVSGIPALETSLSADLRRGAAFSSLPSLSSSPSTVSMSTASSSSSSIASLPSDAATVLLPRGRRMRACANVTSLRSPPAGSETPIIRKLFCKMFSKHPQKGPHTSPVASTTLTPDF